MKKYLAIMGTLFENDENVLIVDNMGLSYLKDEVEELSYIMLKFENIMIYLFYNVYDFIVN
jgi:hypothetical protein